MKDKTQIIPFPKGKTTRVLSYQKAESKQVLGALSLVSLVLVAIFANDQIIKTQRPIYIVSDNESPSAIRDLNRAIASSRPLNPLRDLEWEHQLAKKLGSSSEERGPASFGRQVSNIDQIRFGILAGKYRVVSDSAEKISEFEYNESPDSEDHPQYLDRESFLRKFKDSLTVSYTSFEFEGVKGATETYRLKDNRDQVVGLAQFQLDDQGRLKSFRLPRNASNSPTDSH